MQDDRNELKPSTAGLRCMADKTRQCWFSRPTPPLRSQLRQISVTTRPQLVEHIQECRIKCADSAVYWSGKFSTGSVRATEQQGQQKYIYGSSPYLLHNKLCLRLLITRSAVRARPGEPYSLADLHRRSMGAMERTQTSSRRLEFVIETIVNPTKFVFAFPAIATRR